ncbi:MAG: hypothetical protein GX131_00765 [candidate division WS1 bacterium]|jgi:NADH:ubiquinone oxidoreductase subunit 3 (subunit A)|nr:hypothetical protein [candidate division WS1 bacterium]
MTASGVLYHPVTVFAISMFAASLIYALGRAIAPASRVVGGKLKTYACGENVEGESFPTAYHLYHAAFIFTLLDVVALVIGTVPRSPTLWLAGGYVLVGLVAMIILFKD